MTRLKLSLLGVGVAGLMLSGPVKAQTLTLELGVMTAMAMEPLAGTDLNAAGGVGGTLAIHLSPNLHVYGGWDWLRFFVDRSFAGDERFFEESGYTCGLRFEHAISDDSEEVLRLEGGGTYRHVEIDTESGDLIENSGHSLGFEAGVGLVFPFDHSWRLSPMLRYRSLSPEFDLGGSKVEGDLRYGALEVRIGRKF